MEVVTDDGARLWIDDRPGDGETVLMLHGYTLDHTALASVADAVNDVGARVVVPDLRGHGRSTMGAEHPDLQRFIDDVHAIISSAGLDRVHIVGHSLGAFIALGARADTRLNNGQVKSVVAVSGMERSIVNPLHRAGARLFSSPWGPKMLRSERLGRALMKPWFAPDASEGDLDQVRLLSARCDAPARGLIANATSDIDLRPTFRQPGPPTLVVCGELDEATPLRHSKTITNEIQDSDLFVVGGAGHMVVSEKADEIAKKIVDWISDLDSTS